jgi:malate dehydrogenase (oxaloacetate-decarboxylating)(NADP+)
MTTNLRGVQLLRDPHLNKSTAFSISEREALGLIGLLPDGVDTQELQIRRAREQLALKPNSLEKYIYLAGLQDTDETLFYALLMSDPVEFLPLVYTPTVGEACLHFGHILRRSRGMYISIARRGRVREVLGNWPETDVRFIVVTSGQRILGLGDLGANGMGIPIGKLALYTACGGVPPQFTMPVLLDCGIGNDNLLRDPLYLGLRQPRPDIAELDEFVEEFMTAVQDRFPGCCVQFEDWSGADAARLLDRYRDRFCCFNDDLQGTGAVALAGMLAATRITGSKLNEQTVLFLGAGGAAGGIAGMLVQAMMLEGLSREQALRRIWLFNRTGLIESSRRDLSGFQNDYAHPHQPTADFTAAIEALKPTAIIGVSTATGAFHRRVIEAMARINRRPIIFAFSNPTSRSECTAQQAYEWSEGRAVFASGSPFPPVKLGHRTFVPGQGNNVYIFPAIGLAAYATRAWRVSDEMFIAAARAIAEQVTEADLNVGLIYPPASAILKTEIHAAQRVAQVIFDRGLAGVPEPADPQSFIESQVYQPVYRSLI